MSENKYRKKNSITQVHRFYCVAINANHPAISKSQPMRLKSRPCYAEDDKLSLTTWCYHSYGRLSICWAPLCHFQSNENQGFCYSNKDLLCTREGTREVNFRLTKKVLCGCDKYFFKKINQAIQAQFYFPKSQV